VDVPFWIGKGPYPSVKLRMDFRSADIVGTFLYHCHLLEHEDAGMMGTIRVKARASLLP
jgi:FtsP/CotA-like multicopper oxidase with cupredoxin domain